MRQEVGRQKGSWCRCRCVCGASMNVGETGRGNGVRKRLRGVEGGQRTRSRGGRPGKRQGKGTMSERVASCGSLYDSTNLLLQYCNNGEHISPRTITIIIIIIAYLTKYLVNATIKLCISSHTVSIPSSDSYYWKQTFYICYSFNWYCWQNPVITVVYFSADFSSKTDANPLTPTQVVITNQVCFYLTRFFNEMSTICF